MTKKTYTGVRVQTIKDLDNFLERTKHNTRHKKEKSVVNDNGIITEDDENIKGVKTEYSTNILTTAKQNYQQIINEQKKLNKDFHSKKTRSLAEGILYFSEGINDDVKMDLNEFKKRVRTFIRDFEKENDTEVLNYQIHLDEIGNYHIHFIFKNFDAANGKSLNFTNSKENGGKLQELAGKVFKNFGRGYERGEENTPYKKYLSPHEYAKLKEAEKRLLKVEKELEHTKGLNDELRADNEHLNENNEHLSIRANELQAETDMMRKELLTISSEFKALIDDFEEFIKEEDDKEKLNKLKTLFSRYSKNENSERMLSTINKGRKQLKAIKDKYMRKSSR